MTEAGAQDVELVRTAAAVLVLVDGTAADIAETLRGMTAGDELARIEHTLTTGDRPTRARALAASLGHVALALEQWGLR